MRANSAPVVSNQEGPHPDLQSVVQRHLTTVWRSPGHAPSDAVFAAWPACVAGDDRPLILDSGCGTGFSTRQLVEQHPDAMVLGVDQSAARLHSDAVNLSQIGVRGWLMRARAEAVWRGLREAGRKVALHLLWYPNPWPKSAHLQRRWHGHPAWPDLLAISNQIELRSNWPIYVDEFAQALQASGWHVQRDHVATDEIAVSPFEKKYRESGHPLYRLRAQPD